MHNIIITYYIYINNTKKKNIALIIIINTGMEPFVEKVFSLLLINSTFND